MRSRWPEKFLRSTTGMSGTAFDLATDVTRPVGGVVVSIVAAMVIRYSRTVERVAASLAVTGSGR
jgi:hypothetical protein